MYIYVYYRKLEDNQRIIQKNFLGGCTTKNCDHVCDQAFIKKHLGLCIEYTYISKVDALATSG